MRPALNRSFKYLAADPSIEGAVGRNDVRGFGSWREF